MNVKIGRTIAVYAGAALVAVGFVHYFFVGFDRHSPVEGCAMAALGLVLFWGLVMILKDINSPEDRMDDPDGGDSPKGGLWR